MFPSFRVVSLLLAMPCAPAIALAGGGTSAWAQLNAAGRMAYKADERGNTIPDLEFERTIVAIDGNRLTLDAPIMHAIDAKFGGGSVYRQTFPRIAGCGVENLRLVSEFAKGGENSDEEHAWTGIALGAVENAWVREVTVEHFSHAVQAESTLSPACHPWILRCAQNDSLGRVHL